MNAYLRTALAATLAAACSRAESAANGKQPGAGGGAPPPMPVEVAVAASDTVVDAINASGQVEAIQSIELRPDIEGRLTQILVREGTPVARGTALFKVDDADAAGRGGAGRSRARSGAAGARPHPGPHRAAGVVAGGPRAGRSDGPEH